MKLNKKALWIIGTLILSAITGIFFYLNGHSASATAIGVILAGLTLYFLFQTGQLYNKILVYLIDAVWILIVLLIISLFIY
ncbi:hypothetical protein [Lactobacillus crispatus]|uniref:Uncharacterized protein n=1 Tax=Lactobacillus crispatus (strain ST1) TaxID=748671 RepID=D5H094_LACCS|nr:hypothetical protein [Lactobacillus crispatus]CBL51453.1 putative protein without homology [Lactobacillus crispatus ST1]